MEYLPDFDLHRPETAEEAVRLKAASANSRYLAGGTDMIVNVRRGIEQPAALIDLTAVGELTDIAAENGGLRIGAGVRLRDLAEHTDIRGRFAAVAQAAASVAGPTHRAYGTIGGNLCLDTRCLFYNQSQWWRESNDFCLKNLGEVCHVAPGGKHMLVDGGSIPKIRLDDGPPINYCKPAVDPLFETAAKVYGSATLSLVLTGMGHDGAEGGRAVAAAGGTVLAQDEATSVVWGMPGATARAGVCSAVLPLDRIPGQLANLLKGF